jgi:anti-sigma factor RsiW
MTTCETVQPQLTAYLDGELEGDHGSVVRGHLRECAACRQVARDEAALRDGLRQLAPVDPPPSMWAGVQAQLAAAEVADARKPRWRRDLARWARWAPWPPSLSQCVTGGALAAAAIVMVLWRGHRIEDLAPSGAVAPAIATSRPQLAAPRPPAAAAEPAAPVAPAPDDVTADLIAEPARTTATYGEVVEQLMTLASEARAGWTGEQRTAFDGQLIELRKDVRRAAPGRPQQRAQRQLIRYLQRAVVRNEVVLASGGAR